MNRRSFLSTLALIPGLSWVKPKPETGIIPMEFVGTELKHCTAQIEDGFMSDPRINGQPAVLYKNGERCDGPAAIGVGDRITIKER